MSHLTQSTIGNLIAAERVNGTSVYNPRGDRLGHIEDIMLDKVSGRAVYAVITFGGFLGMGEKQNPLPWSALKFDENLGGYVVDLDRKTIEGAPAHAGADFTWTADYSRRVDQYYNVPTRQL